MTFKRAIVILLVVGVFAGGGWRLWHSSLVQNWRTESAKENLPPAETFPESINQPVVNASEINVNGEALALPAEKNLAVPFTSQAPDANWDQDHGEFCEEASVLMVGRYFQRRGISGPEDAETALQKIKAWEVENLGYYFDTTASETARTMEGVYDVEVQLVRDPTIEHIKLALASGALVIAPFAGQELGNPNFTPPGPIYHMLVIRGYTKDGKFITNDPGTRHGEQYVYDQSVVMSAMHDWIPAGDRTVPRSGKVEGGGKIILVVRAK